MRAVRPANFFCGLDKRAVLHREVLAFLTTQNYALFLRTEPSSGIAFKQRQDPIENKHVAVPTKVLGGPGHVIDELGVEVESVIGLLHKPKPAVSKTAKGEFLAEVLRVIVQAKAD